jgi:hypothetical protein
VQFIDDDDVVVLLFAAEVLVVAVVVDDIFMTVEILTVDDQRPIYRKYSRWILIVSRVAVK